MRLSFRTRLTVLNALVVAAALLGVAFALTATTRRMVLASVENDLLTRAQRIDRGAPIGPPPEGGQPPGAPPQPGEGPSAPGPRRPMPPRFGPDDPGRPRFVFPSGQPAAPDGAPLDPRPLKTARAPVFTTVDFEGRRLRVLTYPMVRGDAVDRLVQIGYPLEDYERLVATQAQLAWTLVPLGLALAALSGWFLAGRALGPVRRATRAASELDERRLDTRLPVEGDDELAELANTFNGMLERLQTSFAERTALVARLEAALERQRRFVADASHELKTPLARLKLTTSAGLEQDTTPGELRESLKIADRSANAMADLVERLLLLARAEGASPAREEVDLLELARSTAEAYPGTQVEGEPCVCRGDAGDLGRAIANLLDNARRASGDGGGVTVRVQRSSDGCRLKVEDDGPGIPAEHLSHLGERFYRVDAARSRRDGGSGLGLAIVRAIAEAHGGRLEIESEVGAGTSATIFLPDPASKQVPNTPGAN